MIDTQQKENHQFNLQTQNNIVDEDTFQDRYGDVDLTKQQNITNRNWIKLCHINELIVGKMILVRARIHNSRIKGKIAFLILRENWSTVQAISIKGDSASSKMLKYIAGIPQESVVDIEAIVLLPEFQIQYCTQKVELQIQTIRVISRPISKLPLQIEDASKKIIDYFDLKKQQNEEQNKETILKKEYYNTQISQNQRLNNRVLDLRTPAKQAIFRVQSGITLLFRQFLVQKDFIEIHTPKLQGFTSQENFSSFKLQYFNQNAYLSQSSGLYQQMSLMADFDRIFEISPVFCALHGNTHQQLCEYTSMDFQMVINEHYTELIDLTEDLCIHMLTELNKKFGQEIQIISQQFEFEPIKIQQPVIRLTFLDGVKLLQLNGFNIDPSYYLDIVNQKQLGKLVKEKFETDLFILYRLPINIGGFYVMPCQEDSQFGLSYVVFLRGVEIASGHQKIHDSDYLSKQIKRQGKDEKILKYYIDSFKFGAFPHGGCKIGLERLLYLYLDLKNIRNACLFPRDSSRLYP